MKILCALLLLMCLTANAVQVSNPSASGGGGSVNATNAIGNNSGVGTNTTLYGTTTVFGLNANNLTLKSYADTNDTFIVSGTNRVELEDMFSASNRVFYIGNDTIFQTRPGTEPATLLFRDLHGGAHGLLGLGGGLGDVVIQPTYNSGILQIGGTGSSGSDHYFQYASIPNASPTKMGFSHGLEFRSQATNNPNGNIYKRPGIVGFPTDTSISEQGQLRFYAIKPLWAFGNQDPDSPTTAGLEVLRMDTNGIVAAAGVSFKGSAAGLTNYPVIALTNNSLSVYGGATWYNQILQIVNGSLQPVITVSPSIGQVIIGDAATSADMSMRSSQGNNFRFGNADGNYIAPVNSPTVGMPSLLLGARAQPTNATLEVIGFTMSTRGYQYFDIGTFPTSAIPVGSTTLTNFATIAYKGKPRTVATNYQAGGWMEWTNAAASGANWYPFTP